LEQLKGLFTAEIAKELREGRKEERLRRAGDLWLRL